MPLYTTTVLARSLPSLHQHVARVAKAYGGQDLTCLFALSTTTPSSEDLEETQRRLTSLLNVKHTIGCLSSPLDGVELVGREKLSGLMSCSIAIFDPNKVVRFRSIIPGKAATQVGRWHSFRRKEPDAVEKSFGENVNWEDIWSGNSQHAALPEELLDADPSDIETILYLTDRAPEGLYRSLQKGFPQATQLGLMAAPTPFINGLPVTLFHNEQVYSSGAVGLALKGKHKAQVEFLNNVVISEPMTVTSCEGNIVHLLNDSNPTRLLIDAIQKSGLHTPGARDYSTDIEQFSLGIVDGNGKLRQPYQISAGDPSRGSISLASEASPPTGSTVQFFHRVKNTPTILPHNIVKDRRHRLTFLTVAETVEKHQDALEEDGVVVLDDLFLAGSDGGIVYRDGVQPGASVASGSLVGSLASIESL